MKTNDVYSTLLAGSSADAKILDAWLDERSMERILSADPLPAEIAEVRQNNARLGLASGAYDTGVAPGQIRILSKRFVQDPDRIPYVAVIEQWEEDVWLVVPFSAYTYPATPGEMTTGIRHLGLRVMQAWNARTVQARLLEKSYVFGTLDEHARKNAADLFRHEFSGKTLPAEFDALTGPAVLFDADPRVDYQAECVAQLRPLSTAVKATERVLTEIYGQEEVVRPEVEEKRREQVLQFDFKAALEKQQCDTVVQPFYGSEEYAEQLAAGSRDQQRSDTYAVYETELSLTYSPEDQFAVFTFYDKDDCPDASFDGYAVLGTGFEFLGTFKNGSIRVPSELVKNWFQITDRDGNAVAVVKK